MLQYTGKAMSKTVEDYIRENEELKKEITALREKEKQYLSLLQRNGIYVPDPNLKLSMDDRIRIFRDYFRTRDDLYAERFYSNKAMKYGWNPACENSFANGCMKGKGKFSCMECPIRKFSRLTDEVILAHFTGTDSKNRQNLGIGLYPMLKDSTVYWLAMDFDEDSWFENMLSVYQAALTHSVCPVMERSASGNGGHLWFFFSQNIPAAQARRFACLLLQEAMTRNPHLSFSSFDRLFPNQDFMPKGGAGNLIAAPFRYDAYRHENSAFINTRGQILKQPFEFLLSRPKITPEEITSICSSYDTEDYFFDNDQLRMSLHTEQKYSSEIRAVLRNRLIIRKTGLNALTVNLLKRVSSMYNPKYIEMQKYHRPIYVNGNVTRVLSYFEEDDKNLYLPRGVLTQLRSLLVETKIITEDKRTEGRPIDISFRGTLREDQKDAVQKLLKYEDGILQAYPGFGKTVAGLFIMAERKVSTLIVVNSKELLEQWKMRIDEWLDYPKAVKKRDSFVRTYSAARKNLGGNIDIAIAKSLANAENLDEIMSQYGLVLIDECHHIACDTFLTIMRQASAKYIYGLSATPKREDGLDKAIFMHCGPIRKRVASTHKHSFTQYLIPRYTNFRWLADDIQYQELCSELTKDTARNYLIFKDIMAEYRSDGKIIVLSERIEHLNILFDMLSAACDDVYMLSGQTKIKERKATLQYIRELKPEDSYILLATSKLLGEGFDLPSLETLFLVLPIKAETRIIQYTGRIERDTGNKDTVKVYDYVDEQVPMANRMYYRRLKQYQASGYLIQENHRETVMERFLYDIGAFEEPLLNDLRSARSEITIFSPAPIISCIRKYHSSLQELFHSGISIHYILSSSCKDKTQEIRYLRGTGGNIIFTDHKKHFIIIDRKIIWSGNMDLLSPLPKSDGYLTRSDNSELAAEIINSIHTDPQEPLNDRNLFTVSSYDDTQ